MGLTFWSRPDFQNIWLKGLDITATTVLTFFFTKFGGNLYFHDFQYFPISYKYDFNLFGILHHKDNGGKPDFFKNMAGRRR